MGCHETSHDQADSQLLCTNRDVLYFGGPVPALTIVNTCYSYHVLIWEGFT